MFCFPSDNEGDGVKCCLLLFVACRDDVSFCGMSAVRLLAAAHWAVTELNVDIFFPPTPSKINKKMVRRFTEIEIYLRGSFSDYYRLTGRDYTCAYVRVYVCIVCRDYTNASGHSAPAASSSAAANYLWNCLAFTTD